MEMSITSNNEENELYEKEEIKKNLHDSQKRMNAIMENAADSIITINSRGIIDSFNRASEKLFGYSFDEVINKNINMLMKEPQKSNHDNYLAQYMSSGKRIITGPREFTGLSKAGELMPIEVSISEFDLSGEKMFLGIVRDIRERKKAEEILIREKTELAGAREANILKDEFLDSISHELRNPLTTVIGFSELIPAKLKIGKTKKVEEYCESINTSANYLLDLINNVLDYSKISANMMKLSKNNVNIFMLINQIELQMNVLLSDKNLTFNIKIPEQFPLVRADTVRITQIFTNLISNAIKFTPYGGQITISAEAQNELLFKISDTGIGIPEDEHKYVFDRFKQIKDDNPKKNGYGTGLGLAITKQLVELHGGEIYIESSADKGSVFSFTLPYL